jgi:hypothetical protein
MKKERVILLSVLFLINLYIVDAQAPTSDLGTEVGIYGKCSNPYINFQYYGYFCREDYATTKEACCPEEAINPEDGIDLYNHPLYPNFPKDRIDCESNFFSTGDNGEKLLKDIIGCEAEGCCFDPLIGCNNEYKSYCTGIEGAEFNNKECKDIESEDWWKDNCRTGCCCDTDNGVYYYDYSKSTCDVIGGTFDATIDSVSACNLKCSPQCSDGVDNDGDKCIDLQDDGCTGYSDNEEGSESCGNGNCDCGENSINCPGECPAETCSNVIDDDGDGCIDYPEDIGCLSMTDTDEIDIGCNNDGDCDCGETRAACPNECPITSCNDGIDNDFDGCKDYPEDEGCLNAQGTSETGGFCDPDLVEDRCDVVTRNRDIYNYQTYGIWTDCYWSEGYQIGKSCFNDYVPWIPFTVEDPELYKQKCCGDDWYERYSYFRVDRSDGSNRDPCDQPGGCYGSSYRSDACCNSPIFYQCAYNNRCHMSEDIYNQNERVAAVVNIDGDNDNIGYAICTGYTAYPYAAWIDCDATINGVNFCDLCDSNSALDFYTAQSGETSVGEYDSVGATECCGDDTNEYYDSCGKDGPSIYVIDWSCTNTDDACCASDNQCVKDNLCYDSQHPLEGLLALEQYIHENLNSGGVDNKAFCAESGDEGTWIDCDFYTPLLGGLLCPAVTCGSQSGVLCGETDCSAGTGEYTDNTSPGCCGDDNNENYICNGVDTSVCRCCNSASDTVDANGNCV